MPSITINGNTFDPATPVPAALGLGGEDAANSNYILIQTKNGRLTAEQITQLETEKAIVHEYVADNTYLCEYKPTGLKGIRRLPFVAAVSVYLPLFVVQSSLKSAPANPEIFGVARATTASRAPKNVDIVFHEGVQVDDALRRQIANAAGVSVDTLQVTGHKIRTFVQENVLEEVARIDAVRSINAVVARTLFNNIARTILNADVVVNNTAYKGEGQVVAVADTGFDKGSASSPHPAFTGRVKSLYALGRTTPSPLTNDPAGHGTHVCGSVLGDGTSRSMGGHIEAPASKARLVVQSTLDTRGGLGGIPANLEDLFRVPYEKDGARVHTNSWGLPYRGTQYSYETGSSASEIDKFVWEHPDMVICFAAGNDGSDANSDGRTDTGRIGAESAAKNCITVGATENKRPEIKWNPPAWAPTAKTFTYGAYFSTDFPQNPIAGDHMANNAEGMAAFSSFGPTVEKRIKPDVVAPGTSILSTCSRDLVKPPTHYGISNDKLWMFDTGTSMATPLVAGCCAVLRETQVKNGLTNPSAALIKAMLINGAVDITGQYAPDESGSSPSPSAGFGRVDLAGSVILPGPNPNAGAGEGPALKQGEEWKTTITISKDAKPKLEIRDTATPVNASRLPHPTLKITMAYSDWPGAKLQNDLNLVVQVGTNERHGNQGTSSFALNSTTGFDTENNVEQIVWTGISAGEVTIKVKCNAVTRATGGAQAFAYAWRIY